MSEDHNADQANTDDANADAAKAGSVRTDKDLDASGHISSEDMSVADLRNEMHDMIGDLRAEITRMRIDQVKSQSNRSWAERNPLFASAAVFVGGVVATRLFSRVFKTKPKKSYIERAQAEVKELLEEAKRQASLAGSGVSRTASEARHSVESTGHHLKKAAESARSSVKKQAEKASKAISDRASRLTESATKSASSVQASAASAADDVADTAESVESAAKAKAQEAKRKAETAEASAEEFVEDITDYDMEDTTVAGMVGNVLKAALISYLVKRATDWALRQR